MKSALILLPEKPYSPNQRVHYMARHRNTKNIRESVAIQARALGKHKGLVDLELTYLTPNRWHVLDYDGLVASMKPVVDGLVDARVAENDDPEHISISYRQEKQPRPTAAVWIVVGEPQRPG